MNAFLERRAWLPAAAAAVVTAVATRLILRNGIFTTPDSWAYWEGSISLLHNHRYEWLGGETLYLWPPLYAIYLAICQWITEPSGVGLIWSSTILAAFSAFVWSLYAISLTRQSGLGRVTQARVAVLACLFVCLFVPFTTFKLLAQTLSIGLTGLIYLLVIRQPSSMSPRAFIVHCAILGGVQALALLTHNTMITLLPGIALVLLSHAAFPFRTRLAGIALNTVLNIVPWLAVRLALQQGGSHPLALGGQIYSLGAYLHQTVLTLGQFFMSNADSFREPATIIGTGFSSLILAAWWLLRKTDQRAWRALVVTVFAYLSLLALFCWTEVFNPISGRFLWAVPLASVPILLILFGDRPAWLVAVLATLICAFPAKRTILFAAHGRLQSQDYSKAFPTSFIIYPQYAMTARPDKRPSPQRRLIRPPTFWWQQRRAAIDTADRPEDVKLLDSSAQSSVP